MQTIQAHANGGDNGGIMSILRETKEKEGWANFRTIQERKLKRKLTDDEKYSYLRGFQNGWRAKGFVFRG
jgi:hypothetical protein